MDIYEIIRRWHSKQSISHIAFALGYDRKTVRGYINHVKKQGISQDKPLPPREELKKVIAGIVKLRQRKQPVRSILEEYKEELIQLINDSSHPLKAKTAFEVIQLRHDLVGKISYSSFKRFFNTHCRIHTKKYTKTPSLTCRIETPAGRMVQIDYAKMGLIYDKESGRNRTVFSFIATLSNCRHKFIDLVYKQTQQSFVKSNVKMFNNFGGVTEIIAIDNLKSGVIKPDLYDPRINRLFSEFAEHYNVFIDPK